jgi:hypothetical protein
LTRTRESLGSIADRLSNPFQLSGVNPSLVKRFEGIFSKALLDIKGLCSENVGEYKRIAAIVLPSNVKYHTDTWEAVKAAGKNILGFIEPGYQIRSRNRLARLHYNLTDCRERSDAYYQGWTGVKPDCWYYNPENDAFQWMLVEYEKGWLRTRILELDMGVDDVLSERLWMDLGETHYKLNVVSWP